MSLSFASGTVPLPSDTLQTLEAKILLALNGIAAGGGGTGSIQVVAYTTTDPTTDGKFPEDLTRAAWAYKEDGTGQNYGWDVSAQVWR